MKSCNIFILMNWNTKQRRTYLMIGSSSMRNWDYILIVKIHINLESLHNLYGYWIL